MSMGRSPSRMFLWVIVLASFLMDKVTAHGKCGTRSLSAQQKKDSNDLAHRWMEEHQDDYRRLQQQQQENTIAHTFPVCWHIVRPTNDPDPEFLNAAALQRQLDALNRGFSAQSCCDTAQPWCTAGQCSIETGIRFAWGLVNEQGSYNASLGTVPSNTNVTNTCSRRYNNDAWYETMEGSEGEVAVVEELRQGNERVLNIYIKRLVNLLGYAQLPTFYTLYPLQDAIVLGEDTIAGGASESYGEGDTLIHEVGHWLGLEHTFEGGCDVGDSVLDTAPEKTEASGCDIGRDTCPAAGADPIHNFLDYSDDVCLYEFTQGQVIRMMSQIEAYRTPGNRENLPLVLDVESDAIDLFEGQVQTYFLDAPISTRIICTSNDDKGDVYLAMRLEEPPVLGSDIYDCGTRQQACAVANQDDPAVLWISLYALKAVQGLQISCATSAILPPIEIRDGVASDPVTLTVSTTQVFTLSPAVDSGDNVRCALSGGVDGDADLFLRWDSEPVSELGLFDCNSTSATSDESCFVTSTSDDSTLFATILAYTDISGVSISCTVFPGRAIVALDEATASESTALEAFEVQTFTFSIEPMARVTCQGIVGENESGAMYLRLGFQPVIGAPLNDCETFDLSGTSRGCQVVDPGTHSELWISVQATSAVTALQVTCTNAVPESISLSNTIASEPISLGNTRIATYRIGVTRGATISCTTEIDAALSDGEVDLFLRFDQMPNLVDGVWDCDAQSPLANETCSVSDPGFAQNLWVSVLAYGPVEGLVVVCTSEVPAVDVEGTTIELSDSVSSDLLSLPTGSAQNFVLRDITPGTLYTCKTSGGDDGQDADLFVRWDEEVDILGGGFACDSTDIGSIEQCSVHAPASATILHATVEAYEAFQDVVLTCSSVTPQDSITLTDGVPSDLFSLEEFATQSFTIEIQPDNSVYCETSSGSALGDIDLYLRWDQEPEIELLLVDCFSIDDFADEQCAARDPGGSTILWATVEAFSDTSDIQITCFLVQPPPAIELIDGTPSDQFDLVEFDVKTFTLSVEAGKSVRCGTIATAGDIDLALRFGQAPFLVFSAFDCASESTSSTESCVVTNDAATASVLWVDADAFENTEGIQVTCATFDPLPPSPPVELFDGVFSLPFDLSAGEEKAFVFNIAPNTKTRCATVCDNGDADLYVRWDALPIPENGTYDCVGAGSTSNEFCVLEDEGFATTLYAVVSPYGSFNNLTVVCMSLSPDMITPLAVNTASDKFSLPIGLIKTFTVNVTSVSNMLCETICDNGDLDMYLAIDAAPAIDDGVYDCASEGETSTERCDIPDLEASSEVFVTLSAFSSFTDAVLFCSSRSTGVGAVAPLTLENGVPSEPFKLRTKQIANYILAVSDASKAVDCYTQASSGDADLYMRWNAEPEPHVPGTLFDCNGEGYDSNERCSIENPDAATGLVAWARVEGFTACDDVILTCTSRPQGQDPVFPPTSPDTKSPTTSPNEQSNAGAPHFGSSAVLILLGFVLYWSTAWQIL